LAEDTLIIKGKTELEVIFDRSVALGCPSTWLSELRAHRPKIITTIAELEKLQSMLPVNNNQI